MQMAYVRACAGSTADFQSNAVDPLRRAGLSSVTGPLCSFQGFGFSTAYPQKE